MPRLISALLCFHMSLWSMVMSPLIFGGDLRNTDEPTFNLITNPMLLEINSFSTNNMEFQSIVLREEINGQYVLRRGPKREKVLKAYYKNRVDLTSCSNPLAKAWKIQSPDEELNEIYWKSTTEDADGAFFHVDKSTLLMQSGDVYEEQYQGKVHLRSITDKDLCLDASATRRLTASKLNISNFSPCEWKSS